MFNRHMLAAAALALSAGTVFAQSVPADPASPPRYDKREAWEHKRIESGKDNGSLTWRERERLQAEQARIRQQERRDKKDGVVTPQEQQQLERMQDRASKDIYRQKHDAQGAVSNGGDKR